MTAKIKWIDVWKLSTQGLNLGNAILTLSKREMELRQWKRFFFIYSSCNFMHFYIKVENVQNHIERDRRIDDVLSKLDDVHNCTYAKIGIINWIYCV